LRKLSEGIEAVDLDGLVANAAQLEGSIRIFNTSREKALSPRIGERDEALDLINAASIKISRELFPILWTEAGK
jgi:hypothetical protein